MLCNDHLQRPRCPGNRHASAGAPVSAGCQAAPHSAQKGTGGNACWIRTKHHSAWECGIFNRQPAPQLITGPPAEAAADPRLRDLCPGQRGGACRAAPAPGAYVETCKCSGSEAPAAATQLSTMPYRSRSALPAHAILAYISMALTHACLCMHSHAFGGTCPSLTVHSSPLTAACLGLRAPSRCCPPPLLG